MIQKLIHKKIFTVSDICDKALQSGMEVGTTFKVSGSNPQIGSLVTHEVVFANELDGRFSFDTLVVGDSFRERYVEDMVTEMRYLAESGSVAVLGSNKRGSMHYHSLLEEQNVK